MKYALLIVLLFFGINANADADQVTLNFNSITSENGEFEITTCADMSAGCTVGDKINLNEGKMVLTTSSDTSGKFSGIIAGKLIWKPVNSSTWTEKNCTTTGGEIKCNLCGVSLGIVKGGDTLIVVTNPGKNCPTQGSASTSTSSTLTEPVIKLFKGIGNNYTIQVCVACRTWKEVKAASSGQPSGNGTQSSTTQAAVAYAGQCTAGLVGLAAALMIF